MPTLTNVVNRAPVVTGTAHQLTSTYSGSPATTATLALATDVVNSNQTLFTAYVSATQSNVSGNGALYKIPYNITTVNQQSGYNTGTYVTTAPVTGNYLFCTSNIVTSPAAGTILADITLVTTTASYILYYTSSFPNANNLGFVGSPVVPMSSGNTVCPIFSSSCQALQEIRHP